MRWLASLLRSNAGSSAAEMALVTPMLIMLMFGSIELGRFFLDEHVVVKAVRDGARYAGRQQLSNYVTSGGCQSSVQDATVLSNIKNLVRTGLVSGDGNRLPYWTDNTTITVSVACHTSTGGQSMTGIYDGITGTGGVAVGAPVVTISVAVPYQPLFNALGFNANGLSLTASQQASVTGV